MVGSSRSHRNTNIEPTERRNSRSVPSTASELPSARFQALDPSSFTPGPFRNTVQQLFNEHQHIQRRPDPTPSVAPTIPPLSFEDNDLSSLHQRIPFQHIRRPTGTAEATSSASTRDVDVRPEQVIAAIAEERRDQQATNRPISDRVAATVPQDGFRRDRCSSSRRFECGPLAAALNDSVENEKALGRVLPASIMRRTRATNSTNQDAFSAYYVNHFTDHGPPCS
jgi:hypothetical protein